MAAAVEADELATEMPSQLGQRNRASMRAARCDAVGGPEDDVVAPTARATPTTTASTTHGIHRQRWFEAAVTSRPLGPRQPVVEERLGHGAVEVRHDLTVGRHENVSGASHPVLERDLAAGVHHGGPRGSRTTE